MPPSHRHTRSFFYASSACIYPEHAQARGAAGGGLLAARPLRWAPVPSLGAEFVSVGF